MPSAAEPRHPARQTIVVSGGGIAENSVAPGAAETGHVVVRIESGPTLGGLAIDDRRSTIEGSNLDEMTKNSGRGGARRACPAGG